MVFPTPANSTTNTNVSAASPTTILLQLQKLFPPSTLSTYWFNEQNTIAGRVGYARRMYEGDHDAGLTKEMMANLRITDQSIGLTANFMPTVVDTKADRCIVQGIEGIEDADDATEQSAADGGGELSVDEQTALTKHTINASTAWAQEVMDNTHFDAIQNDLTTDTIRDGNGYLMAAWDREKKQVVYTVEPAWDGQSGVVMVYSSHQIKIPYAAIKIWQIQNAQPVPDASANVASNPSGLAPDGGMLNSIITTRCNIYYPDRVEKYISYAFGTFMPFTGDDDGKTIINGVGSWTLPDGTPIGIPIVHFRNGGRENYGQSEMRNAWGPQNALNRFHYSAVMAAELTAFAMYLCVGFDAPAALTPGMAINVKKATKDDVILFEKLPASDISPILTMIEAERHIIAEVTRTPSPDLASGSGSNKSGEFLKQLEVGLIGKVKRFTTQAGSSWEQVFELAWKIQQAYGTLKPPPYKRFVCHWQSPEVRNNAEVVTNAMAAFPVMGQRQTISNMAQVWNLDEEKIDEILDKQMKADVAKAVAMQSVQAQPGAMPGQTPAIPDGTPAPANGTPPAAPAAPTVTGNKLPTDVAKSTDHLTQEHLANLFDQYHATKKPSSTQVQAMPMGGATNGKH